MTSTLGRPRRPDSSADQRPLRIVLVEFLPSGGMFQFSFQFAAALARAGHSVTLLTGPDPELTSRVEGLQVESMLPTWHPNADAGHGRWGRLRRVGRALRLLESWRRVLGRLRRERPDVAQFGELRFLLDSAALAVVARLVRPTTVVDVAHNPLPYNVHDADQTVEKTGRLTRALLGRAYTSCGVVLVLGEGPERQLRQHFPALRRVAVCGHGDYAGVLESAEVPRPSAAPPAALFFGAWTTYKNIPLLLDAFAIVRATRPDARLTLAGPVMPDIDLTALRTRAAEIGGSTFAPATWPWRTWPPCSARHRVVMFTYETVNISGSIHMAYTFGRPVVATDVGAMADNVQHGHTGLLVDPDPAAVAGAMITLLDPATADKMGAAAARHAAQGASWSGVVDKAVAAYRSALAEPTRGELRPSSCRGDPRRGCSSRCSRARRSSSRPWRGRRSCRPPRGLSAGRSWSTLRRTRSPEQLRSGSTVTL